MITQKTRRGIIMLVLLTAVSFWLSRKQDSDGPGPVTDLDPSLNYVLRDFELQLFDLKGKATLNVRAPVLRNYPELEIGLIEKPVVVLHHKGATWDLTADEATVTADKEHMVLSGRVNVQRKEHLTNKWQRVQTSEVKIEVTPQTASTDQHVSVFDGRNQINGVGLDLDMKNSKFLIKEQVEASYVVN